ncbi:ABC transporter permease [Neobacillus niacini]|uniref:ABC transporter permease n=1 Tax=Neobacillus niacini TaxID=86668 RepID=UPI0021CB95B8|nr:ABC transporter permease subunit [Neobacillus niacini]MCM3764794.1 ABC transporter permease subunit [Neobacillus niacini]
MIGYKKTIIGSAILLFLLVASILYPAYGPADFNKNVMITDEQGKVIGKAPFPPSLEHPFGTDRNGQDMHLLFLYGAKFTLITAFGVALLRVLFGGMLGLFMSIWAPSLKNVFKDFFMTMRYIPSIFLGLALMWPVIGAVEGVPISSVVSFQIIMLVFIGIPTVTIFSSDVTEQLLSQSFVQSSYLMGASKFHILRKQLMPYIRSYGILLLVQQLLSTLQLIMHLGIFGVFLGGQTAGGIVGYDEPPKPASLSNEWAGLIGQNLFDFNRAPWTIFVPILGFFIVIFIVNSIKKELEENMQGELQWVKSRKKKETAPKDGRMTVKGEFELINKEQSRGYL